MQTIITKFLAPTNTRGARIVAKCWNGKVTIAYPYIETKEAHTEAANALIADLKERTGIEWEIIASGETPDGTGFAFIIQ